MTSTERNNIDNALLTLKQVVRQETQDGVAKYVLYKLVPVQQIPDVAAFGTIYSVTITP